LRIAVDIGGTFTDVVVFDSERNELRFGKSSTQPEHLVQGVLAAIADAGSAAGRAALLIHGSTVVINALVERRGARTALITTRGFRDVYEIGRINRPESFNLFFRKHQPLVPRPLRLEVAERLNAAGEVTVPLDEAQAARVARQLVDAGVEAVAVLFLHAYRNPLHEERMRRLLEEAGPHLFISTSHEVSNEYREFERTSTVVANAYVGPRVRAYLDDLERESAAAGLRAHILLMQSNGGLYDLAAAKRLPLYMLESGPAAGVTGATALARVNGIEKAISFDMGGTTAKAAVILDGSSRMAVDYFVGGYNEGLPLRIPVVDIHEVGMGGGSIAGVDPSGMLTVGPQSAGAEPGPVCYGSDGTEPTVTDANVVLGRIDPRNFLGGRITLDAAAAARALEAKIARVLGLSLDEAANGILRIATASMANAVRAVTTQRGMDPRDFTLIAYGGAGPLHAAAVARELSIPTVLVPRHPGHFSAVGMLYADVRRDHAQTFLRPLRPEVAREMDAVHVLMEGRAREEIRSTGSALLDIVIQRAADMRYVGQEHTVTVPIPLDLGEAGAETIKRRFDELHEAHYSHAAPGEPAELVTLRSAVIGIVAKPEIPALARGHASPPDAARRPAREVFFEGLDKRALTAVYGRDQLLAGNVIAGPAVIEEDASTTLVPPGDRVRVHEHGHLLMEVVIR
jgi:N-methylhydantoinase A